MNAISPVLGRSERRAAAARYVEGLLLEGKRKSIEPLAQRLGVDAQSLQQFVADSPWDEALVWSRIRREVIAHFEPIESWIMDETAWLKQGRHSVGVAQQYCGAIGKNANCQLNVQLTVSNGVVAAPVWPRACSCPKVGPAIGPDAPRLAFPSRFLTRPKPRLPFN